MSDKLTIDELKAQFRVIDAATKWYSAFALFERTEGAEGERDLQKAQEELAEACRTHNKTQRELAKYLRGMFGTIANGDSKSEGM